LIFLDFSVSFLGFLGFLDFLDFLASRISWEIPY